MSCVTRTLTVLFTDMVGSTALIGRLGPAGGEALRARHFAAMRSALAVHRGREIKTLGDGFMVVFDSAGDALACAVTMQQAGEREPGPGIRIRVGLSSGEVTCDGHDVHGMPVVEASRLCAAAAGGQILVADVVRVLVGSGGMHRFAPIGPLALKGLPAPTVAWEIGWEPARDTTLRVAIAEDSVLLREGIVRVLESESIEVVLQASDADTLLDGLAAARPHVVLLDVRMPPTHTDEGLRAAEQIRALHPELGVIVLSHDVSAAAAMRLLGDATKGIGYLLKERVSDPAQLTGAIRTVAAGGSAIDPEVIARLGDGSRA